MPHPKMGRKLEAQAVGEPFFFVHPIYYLRPSFFSLPPSRNSDARGRTVGSCPPSPVLYQVRVLHFFVERRICFN